MKYMLLVVSCLLLITMECRKNDMQIKQITVSFLGTQKRNMVDSAQDSIKNNISYCSKKIWSTVITDSLFIESIKNYKKWKNAPVYSCAINVIIEIKYLNNGIQALEASIFDECPFIEYESKEGLKAKYFEEYVLNYLKNLIKKVPDEIDGWEKL